MSPKEKTYRAQVKTVIERVLEHRNDAFKAKVLRCLVCSSAIANRATRQ